MPEDFDIDKYRAYLLWDAEDNVQEIREDLLSARKVIEGWPCPSDECRSEYVRNNFLAHNLAAINTLDDYTATLKKGILHPTIEWFLDDWHRGIFRNRLGEDVEKGFPTMFVKLPDGRAIPCVQPPPLGEVADPIEAEAPNPPASADIPPVVPASGPIPPPDTSSS